MLKDHSRDHITARDAVISNNELIVKYTIDLQRNISELQEMLTIISWYLESEKVKIDLHYNDMPLEHLTKMCVAYSDYCGDLVNMDTSVRQCIYMLGKRFRVEDPDIDMIKRKISGDR